VAAAVKAAAAVNRMAFMASSLSGCEEKVRPAPDEVSLKGGHDLDLRMASQVEA
jgi:hypothetical protein